MNSREETNRTPHRTSAGRTNAGRTNTGRTSSGRTNAGRTGSGRTNTGRTGAGSANRGTGKRKVSPVVGSADDWREPNTKLLMILVLAAVFAAAVFLVYWFVLRGSSSGKSPESSAGNIPVQHEELHEDHPGLAGAALDFDLNETEGAAGALFYADETEQDEEISFQPHAVESTKPSNMIEFEQVEANGQILSGGGYHAPREISFDRGSVYAQADGIFTFRGNNFRDTASAGLADIKKNQITQVWNQETGATSYNGNAWTGSGWTGQPLMRRWTREEKAHMNMADWAKQKDDLVEVIYATMDGNVYFLDLETGEQTRDPMYIGWTFKGAGALDPRGYPIMYLGAGINSTLGVAHAFVINLVDCSIIYEFGGDDAFSLRGTFGFMDSSPLVDAETDTLIWPAENGILFMIHLNSSWDPQTGTLTVNPDSTVKWRCKGLRTTTDGVSPYWVGYEDSCAVYKGYLFVADNGGHLLCLDLNTLQLVWVQDILDDSNSSPVLSVEDGHLYLYISTSFHLGWRSYNTAPVPIWKIDAETGEIVWQTEYECYTMDGVSGGVQSTMALGKRDLNGYIYATVAMTGGQLDGVCVCLDCRTGKIVWEHKAYYAWSSPVLVYNKDGTSRLIYCTCGGFMYMLDPKTGKELAKSELSNGAIEASPAVWGNYAVIGTRACKIWGLRLD